MKNAPKEPVSLPKKPTLNRVLRRVLLSSFTVGFILIFVYIITIPENIDEDVSKTNDYSSRTTDRTTYFSNVKDSEKDNRPILGMHSAIEALEPQVAKLEDRIEALEEAKTSNWQNRRAEVVQAWEKFQSIYETVSENKPNS